MSAYYKPQKKGLPYTITDIGDKEDLIKWKAEQVNKEKKFQAAKLARVNKVKTMLDDGSIADRDKDKQKVASETTKAWERYHTQQVELVDAYREKRDKIRLPDLMNYKRPSALRRWLTSIYDTFLNLKFN